MGFVGAMVPSLFEDLAPILLSKKLSFYPTSMQIHLHIHQVIFFTNSFLDTELTWMLDLFVIERRKHSLV